MEVESCAAFGACQNLFAKGGQAVFLAYLMGYLMDYMVGSLFSSRVLLAPYLAPYLFGSLIILRNAHHQITTDQIVKIIGEGADAMQEGVEVEGQLEVYHLIQPSNAPSSDFGVGSAVIALIQVGKVTAPPLAMHVVSADQQS